MAAVNHHNHTSFINCQVPPSSGIVTVSSFHSKMVFKYDPLLSGHIYQRDGSQDVPMVK